MNYDERIKKLDLSDEFHFSDVTALSTLTNLEELNLMWTRVTDLTPLTPLTKLTTLILRNVPVNDLRPLAYLVTLQKLNLSRTSDTPDGDPKHVMSGRLNALRRTRIND